MTCLMGRQVSERRIFILAHQQARANAIEAVANAPDGYCVTIQEKTRTQAQNRLMWPILECFSKQLQWPINGQMVHMEPEDWKDVLTAAFRGETVRLAMGLNGGVVMLGQRTSKFSKSEFSSWIEFLYATAADRGVRLPAWSWDQ